MFQYIGVDVASETLEVGGTTTEEDPAVCQHALRRWLESIRAVADQAALPIGYR
jgi:hypothetical protein